MMAGTKALDEGLECRDFAMFAIQPNGERNEVRNISHVPAITERLRQMKKDKCSECRNQVRLKRLTDEFEVDEVLRVKSCRFGETPPTCCEFHKKDR